ncbi:hypothetical protein XM38_048350 [Halomicronema hongdechloris C2206]|uniref:Uncharacterized protein n=1 Tax=Halomicronema hongdechloris C2206 TaxID=1641165 RepID=A0A1Z3HU72_9CYAN|nr:P-loop NTPase fold protein [Halomicronema hongdechloris]ASC73861.1 hypothetical protein XM38_048350 [Halomicronema hongdechloris C2206]
MTSLKQLVKRNLNPFDPSTFRPGNFWQENQDPNLVVDAIHWQILQEIEQTINQITVDHITRTILLAGASGSGKSYLLGRLKRQLNNKAFFAYIGPWPDSNYLWRHTLRNTIDSLIHVPEGQSESQLLLWLKSLPSLRNRSLTKWILGERGTFVRDLAASFPAGIYNGKEFFGVLYDLATNFDLRMLAYAWLKGDDLDKEDLQKLQVRKSITSEDAAQKILGNIGRIADSTQPIVLCFDNLDSIPRLPNGKPDLQSLFNLNSTIHNENLKNFLVLISVVSSTWQANRNTIQPADKARINQVLQLRQINLDQAAALWATRLAPLHAQARPEPESPIAPLTRNWLKHQFPGEKALPRNVLKLGQQLITYYKQHGRMPKFPPDKVKGDGDNGQGTGEQKLASFQLTWDKEFRSVRQKVMRINQFSSPELIWRLRQALEALEVPQITSQFLQSSTYASYSLSYQKSNRTGIVWSEDPNMQSFYHIMKSCQKMVTNQFCDHLFLIRAEGVGQAKNKGHQIYRQIFDSRANCIHIKPDLLSLQYLETYHQLANAARAGELVIDQKTPHLQDLQSFVRQSKVLEQCPLLQKLQLVTGNPPPPPLEEVRRYVLNLMTTQLFIGLMVLIESTQQQFPDLSEQEIDQVIEALCQENRIQVLDPRASRQAQLICYVTP